MRTCTIDSCQRKLHSRGLCNMHRLRLLRHGDANVEPAPSRACAAPRCHRTKDIGTYCLGHHKRLVLGTTRVAREPVPPSSRVWIKDCAWCGRTFIGRMPHSTDCSPRCSKRRHDRARRAREHDALGTYTWADVIRLWLLFNHCCAYCERPTIGQPDPDHVVPLSRGGSNGPGNILPACRACNCDKRNLLLHEWNADRARRGLAPRRTTWHHDDPRFAHLHEPHGATQRLEV